jgi:hypothetical protein
VLGNVEGKVMGNALLQCVTLEISRIFGQNFEFPATLLQNFDNGIARNRKTSLISVFFCGGRLVAN